nr:MAG TPA: hypothetical protein [Caudoviricetes sp.]
MYIFRFSTAYRTALCFHSDSSSSFNSSGVRIGARVF